MRMSATELTAWRHELGLSQSALAKIIGVTIRSVSRFECGTSRSRLMEYAIYRALQEYAKAPHPVSTRRNKLQAA